MPKFDEKLERILSARDNRTVLMISPVVMKMPLSVKQYDDPFLPFGQTVIRATRDLVCGYLYDFTKYMALGAAGGIALERTIAYAGFDMLNILHGPFAHPDFINITDETAFNADGLTVAPELPFVSSREDRAVFNLNGQRLFSIDERVWLRVADESVLYADFSDDYASALQDTVRRFNEDT